MGVLGTYCFDGLNFSQASSLYTNSTLSVLAADGFYSQGGVVRQQSNGVLLAAQACGACSVPCGNGISVSLSQNGFFDINFDVGNTLGAVVAYFYMGNSIADGVIANFNSVNYNRLTAQGNDGTTLVDGSGTAVDYSGIGNQGTGDPTYVGSDTANIIRAYTNTSITPGVCNTGDAPENYSYAGSSYVAQGTLNPLTVTNIMCGRALSGSPVFTMVIPKTGVSPSSLNLKISAPACGTFFAYELDCPVGLSSFGSSIGQSNTTCAVETETYYFAKNATGTNVPFTVDTNTIPNVGNFVFTDANGVTYLNDTATIQYYITGNTTAIGVRNGVVISSATCTSAAEPCGSGLTIPSGQTGYYNLDFDAGGTASDTGAIIIYFNPQSIPDGIRVLYDNVFYNTVTNNNEGRIQSTSGVTGAFTILGSSTDTCVPSTPNTSSYTFFDGIVNGAWNNTGTTQNITINTGDDVRGGQSQYSTLVVPKPNATPNIVSIQVLGACSSTGWNVQVSCPAALPSVLASGPGATDTCQTTQNTSVYFAKNYNDTNTAPIVGNFVFTDENGATPLNNTSTVKYYTTGTIALSVLNGVVVSSAQCGTGGTTKLRISDCQTGNTWTMTNTYGHVLTDVLQYQQGTPGQGAVYCGTVTQVNISGTNDATVNGAQSYSCGDSTHCLQ